MDTTNLLPFFYLEVPPHWTCPTCNEGSLEVIPREVKKWETAASVIERGMDDWEPDWRRGTFHLVIKCSRDWCGERVVVTGVITWEHHDEGETVRFAPKCFEPALNIIQVPDKAPRSIHRTVHIAGALLFADPSSSGNKVRIAVEQLMDHFKVKRFEKRGKRVPIPLQRRLDAFKHLHPEEAELLTACKWLGNVASHGSEQLTFRQAVEGFEILEHVLQGLLDDKSKRITRMAKAVNKRKGKLPKRRT